MIFFGKKHGDYVPIRVDVWLEQCRSVPKINADGKVAFVCRACGGWFSVPAEIQGKDIVSKVIDFGIKITIEDVVLVNWTLNEKMRLAATFPIKTEKIDWIIPSIVK